MMVQLCQGPDCTARPQLPQPAPPGTSTDTHPPVGSRLYLSSAPQYCPLLWVVLYLFFYRGSLHKFCSPVSGWTFWISSVAFALRGRLPYHVQVQWGCTRVVKCAVCAVLTFGSWFARSHEAALLLLLPQHPVGVAI